MRELTEAQQARQRASSALVETIHHGTEVRATVESLRELRETNHFSEMMAEAYRRRALP